MEPRPGNGRFVCVHAPCNQCADDSAQYVPTSCFGKSGISRGVHMHGATTLRHERASTLQHHGCGCHRAQRFDCTDTVLLYSISMVAPAQQSGRFTHVRSNDIPVHEHPEKIRYASQGIECISIQHHG